MAVAVTVCTTCKFSPEAAFDQSGRTGGEILATRLEILTADGAAAIEIVRQQCLWACRQSCAILIEAPHKTGYLAGRFTPDMAAAQSIAAWTTAYSASPDGAVPFQYWPDGMKGHFIARIPARAGDMP